MPRTQAAQRYAFAEPGTPVKPTQRQRRYPGRRRGAGVGVHFRVWAPISKTVDVVFDGGGTVSLEAEVSGYFSGFVSERRAPAPATNTGSTAGKLVPIRLPASSPRGHMVRQKLSIPRHSIGPIRNWRGVALPGQVIYEMHIGTFTKDGTWRSAQAATAASGRNRHHCSWN